MLINIKRKSNKIGDYISKVSGFKKSGKKHRKGIYEIGHFNFEYSIDDSHKIEKHPDLENEFPEHGVCDNVNQIFEQCPSIKESKRKFIISLTLIDPNMQPPDGGWRWHKWGDYIGNQEVKTEYIYNQKDELDPVWVYHVIEIL